MPDELRANQDSELIDINKLSRSFLADTEPGFSIYRTGLPENNATGSILGAAFTNDNSLVSLGQKISMTHSLGRVVTPGFDPIPHVFPGYEEFTDEFLQAQSVDDMITIKNLIDRQANAKQLLSQNPIRGFFAGIPANLFDPTTLLPGGIFWNEAKAARSVFQSAARVSAAATTSAAIQETALSQTQISRGFEESFWNVISASLLGGVFGGIGGKVIGGVSGERTTKEISHILEGEVFGPVPDGHHYTTQPKGPTPRLPRGAIEGEFKVVQDSIFGGPKALGADVLSLEQLKQSESLWRIQPFIDKFPQFTPTLRLLKSPFGASRRLANLLSETMFISNKNFEGGTNANIETRIKQRMQTFMPEMVVIINDGYHNQRATKVRAPIIRDIVSGLSQVGLDRNTYNLELSRALRNNGASENPQVEAVANKLIDRIIGQLRDEAIELDQLPEGVTPETALGYLTKIRNIPAIIEDMAVDASRGGKKYLNIVLDAFTAANNQLIAIEPQLKVMRDDIAKAQGVVKKQSKNIKELKRLKALEKKTRKEAAELKRLAKEIKERPLKELKALVKAAEKQMDDFVPRRLKRRLKNGKLEIRKIQDEDALFIEANKSIERIIGTNDDRFESPLFSDMAGRTTNPDVFHERVLMVDDHMEEAFLINDPEMLLSYMVKAMVPNIEFKKMANAMQVDSIEGMRANLLNEITSEMNLLLERGELKDPEKARQTMARDIKDVEALIDINLGIYGNGFNVFSPAGKEFMKNLRDWNFSRMGGFMGMASIMEPLSHSLKVGPFKMLERGMLPSIRSWVSSIQSLSESSQIALLRSLGYGMQSEMGSIAKHMLDGRGLGVNKSIYRRVFSSLADLTAELNMLKKLQDIAENITGRQVISGILEDVDLWKQGKLSAKGDARLNALGMNKAARDWLHQQWKKFGGIEDGAFWIDHTAIENIQGRSGEYYNTFRDGIVKDIDTSVVKSGAADKPLYAHSETGKVLFQFKNWAMGATNRLAMAGFQRSDIEFYTGSLFMLFGGLMSYITTSILRNQEIDWSFGNLALESIDRSGLFGVYMEGANILLKGLFGTGPSRYQSRTLAGAFLGPSIGAPDELLKLFNKMYRASIPDGDPLKTRDLAAAQRLIPLQNMWFAYTGNRAITNQIGMGLGLEE